MATPCILAVDTTTTKGSVAVCRGDRLLVEKRWLAAESHSERLLQEIDDARQDLGGHWEALTHWAAVCGPGSFTGIRIGLGTILGLAQASGLPVLGVTAFEALAFAVAPQNVPIHCVIDARRNQVYQQMFESSSTGLPLSVRPFSCDDCAVWLNTLHESPAVFVGSGASLYRREIEKRSEAFQVLAEIEWLAQYAACIAAYKVTSGMDAGRSTVDALYIRPPDVRLPSFKKVSPAV